MAGSTDVQESPCDLELSLDAPSLMSFPSFLGRDRGFFFLRPDPHPVSSP